MEIKDGINCKVGFKHYTSIPEKLVITVLEVLYNFTGNVLSMLRLFPCLNDRNIG